MIEPISEAGKTFGIFSALDRTTERTNFFLLVAFVLAADCGLLHIYKVGLLQIAGMPELIKPQLAINSVILFVLFSGLMSIVMPRLSVILYDLIVHTVYALWMNIRLRVFPDVPLIPRPDQGFVRFYQLKDKAYKTFDSFYVAALKEARDNIIQKESDKLRTVILSTTALILSLVDFLFRTSPKSPSLLQGIAVSLGEDGNWWIWIFFATLAFVAYRPIFAEADTDVYCPPLADEIWAEERKQAKEELMRRGPPGPAIGRVAKDSLTKKSQAASK